MSTSTVASPRAARPAPPILRHGTCRWSVYIATDGRTGGKHYSVTPLADQPGFRGVWRIRAHGTDTAYTVAAPKTGRPGCTCPDHETRGTACKHIMALAALGLIKRPKDKPAPSQAKALRAHAKTARANVAAANALPAEVRRHLAAMGPEPAIVLPEGWQLGGSPVVPAPAPAPAPKALPPAPEGSFTAGFRAAVETYLAVKHGDLIECRACDYPFDPEAEGDALRGLCGPCLQEEEGGAR